MHVRPAVTGSGCRTNSPRPESGPGLGYGIGQTSASSTKKETTACSQLKAIEVKPWRWPGPDHALWTQAGLRAWTMVNDRPDAPVTDASYFSIFVAARSNDELAAVGDAGRDAPLLSSASAGVNRWCGAVRFRGSVFAWAG